MERPARVLVWDPTLETGPSRSQLPTLTLPRVTGTKTPPTSWPHPRSLAVSSPTRGPQAGGDHEASPAHGGSTSLTLCAKQNFKCQFFQFAQHFCANAPTDGIVCLSLEFLSTLHNCKHLRPAFSHSQNTIYHLGALRPASGNGW